MTKEICIYHANCVDGVGAAFALWYHHNGHPYFIPASYGDDWRELLSEHEQEASNTDVYIVDFSFPKEELLALADAFKTVTVLDHHKSAKEDCESIIAPPNLDITFDMERSGAGLTWDYYSELRPRVIDLIEDRDLWRFQFPESKALQMELADFKKSTPLTGADFLAFAELLDEAKLTVACLNGQAKLDYHNARVIEVARTAVDVEWNLPDLKIAVKLVNCPYFMASDMGEYLRNDCDVSCMYNLDLRRKTVGLSFRSKEVDVSKIASTHFNGGGHKNAAGGWTTLEDFTTKWSVKTYTTSSSTSTMPKGARDDEDIEDMFDVVLNDVDSRSDFGEMLHDLYDWWQRKGWLTERQYETLERSYNRSR